MKREIKFRGKRLDNKEWVFGGFHKPFEDVTQIIEKAKSNASQMTLVYDYTLGQFTGLKDKNGVEIYEGDILKIHENKNGFFEVVFINAYVGGWILKHKDYDVISLGARKQEHCEVIGNIYENPELL